MSHCVDRESLFEAWLKEHRGVIEKVTRTFTEVPSDAAELRQEMMLQLWLSIGSFAGEAKPSTWIYRVCLYTAMTWRRTLMRREAHIGHSLDLEQIRAEAPSPAEGTAERELLEKLYAGIRKMPGHERALILMMLDGLAYREIAQVTGLTENNIGVALGRARKRLAEIMKGLINELE
jgi:RNA polymerase sigma-70 factor (ECF subfamily)